MQIAALGAGAVVVGLDPHDLGTRLSEIATRAGITILFAETPHLVDKLAEGVRQALNLVVLLEDTEGVPGTGGTYVRLEELLCTSDTPEEWDTSRPDDLAMIVFTSGTTGAPKGIAYTHRQVCLAANALLEAFSDIREGSRLACWLPLSNLFQRMVNVCAIGRGAQIYYVSNPREIMSLVRHINPHVFIGVPRFYEKLYGGMMNRVAAMPRLLRAAVFWALARGDARVRAARGGAPYRTFARIEHGIADRLVLRRLRQVMGKNLRYMISGSAPMPRWLLDRFDAIGLPVLEAYGLSESIIPVATNRPSAVRLGTVGKPLPGMQVKLAEDGEVLIRGPGVFGGYYAETESVHRFDADGFLATGDFGAIDGDDFLTLTGRKSEVFKTSTGRRIAPAQIEAVLLQVTFVEHAIVFGANRQAPIALLSVSPAIMEALQYRHFGDPREGKHGLLAACATLCLDLRRAVQELPAYQRPEGLVVTTRPLTVEAGELTSNLKPRRERIAQRYEKYLSKLDRGLSAGAVISPVDDETDVVLCKL